MERLHTPAFRNLEPTGHRFPECSFGEVAGAVAGRFAGGLVFAVDPGPNLLIGQLIDQPTRLLLRAVDLGCPPRVIASTSASVVARLSSWSHTS